MENSIIHEKEIYLSQGKEVNLIQSNVADSHNIMGDLSLNCLACELDHCIRLCQQTGPELS